MMGEVFTVNRHGHRRERTIRFGPQDSPKRGKPRCSAKVWQKEAYDYSQCSSVGKVEADGFMWCAMHSPAADERRAQEKERRNAEREAKWRAAALRARDRLSREAAYPIFLQALQTIAAGANDARAVAEAALRAINLKAD